MSARGIHPFEPPVRPCDLKLVGGTRWEDIDAAGARLLGRVCVGLPSVRVGLGWALEYLACGRHRDHVLLPKFVGRCIVNALGRHALPVEEPTTRTRVAIAVDQYGLRQDVEAIAAECRRRGYVWMEDSPYGIGNAEAPSPGSLARFIGLAKPLPVVQGALMLSDDARLVEFVRRKRAEHSAWSWLVWAAMAALRSRRRVAGPCAIADAIYEMYPHGAGGNAWLRGNLLRGLEEAEGIASVHARRRALLERRLGPRLLLPDLARLGFVVPYRADGVEPEAAEIFRRFSVDATVYHVDVARNLFAPRYVRTLLVPLNARIRDEVFEGLIGALAGLETPASVAAQLASASTQHHSGPSWS